MSEIVNIDKARDVVRLEGVSDRDAENILTAYAPFYEDLVMAIESASCVEDSDVASARRERLRLKNIRVGAEKARKLLKDESLRKGRAIDSVNKVLVEALVPHEQRMDDIEKAEERRIAAEKAALHAERVAALAEFCDASVFGDLSGVSAEAFASMLEGQRLAAEARAKAAEEARVAAEKAEAERKAAEAAERQRLAEEAERQRIERERLAAERAEQERIAAAERAKIEAERKAADEQARAERERIAAEAAKVRAEQERIAAAERERIAAEAAERKRLEDEARRAALAPDADKLDAYADALLAVRCAEMSGQAGERAEAAVRDLCNKFRDFAASMRK